MDPGLTPVVPSFTGPSTSRPHHELPRLETLEHYKLGARLGQGGMAEVFLAAREVAPFVHHPVVVKRLHRHFAEDPNLVQMFLDEARLLCRLDHPHIVRTLEAGVIDGQCCIAMEYLEGQPLHVVLRRAFEGGELPIELAVYIVVSILEGLGHAHDATDEEGRSLSIVHRDISPQNVFVTSNGHVKVLDFGIAKATSHEGRTAAGMVKGKVGYIAPEQARAEELDRRADLWSAGILLWEALTGTRLFKADTEAGAINLTLKGEIPSVGSIRLGVPLALELVLARALQRDPARRFQTAGDMREALEAWMEQAGYAKRPEALASLMQQAFADELVEQRRHVSMLIALSDCTPPSIRVAPLSDGPSSTSGLVVSAGEPDEISLLVPRARGRGGRFSGYALGIAGLFALGSAGATRVVMEKLGLDRGEPHAAALASAETVPAASTAPPSVAPVPASSAPVPSVPSLASPARATLAFAVTSRVASTAATPAKRLPVSLPSALSDQAIAPHTGAVDAVPAPRTRPGDPEATGFLTIDSSPWAMVSLGGKSLGQTPLVGVKLPVGTHLLTLRNPDLGIETTYSVSIEPGKTAKRRIGLE
jgi:eukaryotic-like serine/threonine-protein kinase